MENNLASLLRDFAQGASNSAATNLSMPVDAIAWLLRKGGMNIPNNPVGGSDWLAEKGFTPEPKNKLAGLLGDVAGFAAPLAAVSKAPQIAKGLLQMGEAMPMGSKGVPPLSKASPMADRGAVNVGSKFEYPQSQAIELAQQRAALPVSEGGLGLPANNTAMDRANVMGFDTKTPLYHGTGSDIHAFDPRMAGKNDEGLWGRGQYLTTSPNSASSYAFREGDGANVIPAYASIKSPMKVTTGSDLITRMPDGTDTRALIGYNLDGAKIKEIAKSSGHDGVFQIKPDGNLGDIVAFDPSSIRSRFAAFDPWRRNAAIAATMGVAAPDLLANPLDDKNNRLIDILRNK